VPELPEAETIARGLDRLIRGRRLLGVKCLFRGICERRGKYPVGVRVSSVGRRAKKVLIHFDDGSTLLVSLGMSGQLRRRRGRELPPHTHLILTFEGAEILYVDPRRLGRLTPARPATTMWAPTEEVSAWCDDRFGPDANTVGWREFRERVAGRRGALKPLLLNQRVIAGIGNIYADEILHCSGLHPRAVPAELTEEQLRRLHRNTRAVLARAIKACGTTFRDYVTPTGSAGDFGDSLAVYGREGETCRKCGTAIERLSWPAGRSTYYCPACQPEPR
jgi:formamidopyrimidine-DNA glycosylase